MDNCIFCKIVKGEIPCYKVYEDDKFLAFLDIKPRNPGHTLVIPKDHYRWVWDVANLGEYYQVVGKIANAIKQAYKIDQVISVVSGEDVPHAHVWLVPRFVDDAHGAFLDFQNVKTLSPDEMKAVVEKISKEI